MKKIVLSLLAFILINQSIGLAGNIIDGNNPVFPENDNGANTSLTGNQGNKGGAPNGTLAINQFDSVYFDIEHAVINGNMIEFPVLIHSDDIINALDFAFKYDQTHLLYDTIINLTSYIDPLSYYNPNDSTVRLTSYSISQPYSNDTPLVTIRFSILNGGLCAGDIDSVSAMLNGDICSYFISDCTSGIFEATSQVPVNLYPNPASDFINVEVPGMKTIEIYDIQSRLILKVNNTIPAQSNILEVNEYKNGSYFLKITGSDYVAFKKFVIAR